MTEEACLVSTRYTVTKVAEVMKSAGSSGGSSGTGLGSSM